MIAIAIKTLSLIDFRIEDFKSTSYFLGEQQQTLVLKHRKEGKNI